MMRSVLTAFMLIFPGAAAAAPVDVSIVDNVASVVRVRVGDDHGSGLVVSKSGHVLTSAVLIDGCENCAMAVGDGTDKERLVKATLVKVDYPAGLALLKAETKLPSVYALEDLASVRPRDGLIIVGVRRGETKAPLERKVLSPSYDKGRVLSDYEGAPGMLGAAGYSAKTGRLVGIIIHGEHYERGGERGFGALLAPPKAIAAFLKANNVPVPQD